MKQILLLSFAALMSLPALAGHTIEVDTPEPSGIDIDHLGGRIFVADDGGEVWVFDEDYRPIDVFDIGGDLEGIFYVPNIDQLLVAAEGDEQLLLVDPDTGAVNNVFDIPRTYQGETILAEGGNGIETLTMVGQRIFVANQSFDPSDTEDGSILVELAMTLTGELAIVRAHPLPIMDVAGSFYSPKSGELFLLSDAEDRAYRLSLRAMDQLEADAPLPSQMLRPFWVPGDNQEGMAVVGGSLIIAQDSGDLYDAGSLRWLLSPAGQQQTVQEWGY